MAGQLEYDLHEPRRMEWPELAPRLPQRPVVLFNGVVAQWLFTCDMRVFLEVTVAA